MRAFPGAITRGIDHTAPTTNNARTDTPPRRTTSPTISHATANTPKAILFSATVLNNP